MMLNIHFCKNFTLCEILYSTPSSKDLTTSFRESIFHAVVSTKGSLAFCEVAQCQYGFLHKT